MDEKTEYKPSMAAVWPQWIGGVGGLLLLLQIGIMAGWTSPYIAQMTSEGLPFRITMTEASWVVSLLNLGRLVGAVVGATAVNYLGSKATILITSMPIAVGWIFTIVANHVIWLYASRFLGGISLGMIYSSFSIYLGEIAHPGIRGGLVALGMSGMTIGNLVICTMGAYFPMEISGAVSLALCNVLTILFIWLPESPHHLIKKNLDDKAKASIAWYHRGCDVDREYASLKKFVDTYSAQSFFKILKEFQTPSIRKAGVVLVFLFMYSQMCGLNNVIFYMETLLRSAEVSVIDPSLVVVIVTVFGILSSWMSMFLIDRYGRRILMISSVFFVSISLVCLGTTFVMISSGQDPQSMQGLPIFAVILFQVSVFIGILSVPSTLMGELFPPHVKCVAACLSSITAGVFSFISAATYQPLVDLIGEEYIFFGYTVLLVTAIPFILLFVPETKGKSLQEIQTELMKKG